MTHNTGKTRFGCLKHSHLNREAKLAIFDSLPSYARQRLADNPTQVCPACVERTINKLRTNLRPTTDDPIGLSTKVDLQTRMVKNFDALYTVSVRRYRAAFPELNEFYEDPIGLELQL